MNNKMILNKKQQEKMLEFFSKTSIPRMLKKEKNK